MTSDVLKAEVSKRLLLLPDPSQRLWTVGHTQTLSLLH